MSGRYVCAKYATTEDCYLSKLSKIKIGAKRQSTTTGKLTLEPNRPPTQEDVQMYRYVEQEKVEGKTTTTGGTTRKSLRALKHLPKIGVPLYVRGYVYHGRYDTNHVAVLVRGTLGTIRFGGFGWGYGGEGPRGLKKLFEALGVEKDPATLANWPDFSDDSVGEHWRIKIGAKRQSTTTGKLTLEPKPA